MEFEIKETKESDYENEHIQPIHKIIQEFLITWLNVLFDQSRSTILNLKNIILWVSVPYWIWSLHWN